MLEGWVRLLGSVRLAVPLLGAIATILIGATFYEARVGSTLAQQQIYKSVWFGALMFLLALNLTISLLRRYPWRGARKVGFALTHAGLVVLFAGSAAVIHLGVEGMLPLRENGPAGDRIRLPGDALEVVSPTGEVERAPVFIGSEGRLASTSAAGVSLRGYSENAVRGARFVPGARADNPAARLLLHSDRMGQTLERWLAIAPPGYDRIELGPAELAIVRAETPEALAAFLAPEEKEERGRLGTLRFSSSAGETNISVADSLGKTIALADGVRITVAEFFPDFRLAGGEATTISSEPNNPAVLLDVVSDAGAERWFVFARGNFPPIRTSIAGELRSDSSPRPKPDFNVTYALSPRSPQNFFHVVVGSSGDLHYAARSSARFVSGELAVGQTVRPGWADFEISLAAFLPRGQIRREVVPDASEPGAPALLVELASGTRAWLPQGEPTAIADGTATVYAAFQPQQLQLPFAIALKDFIVERNEGSASVAMWASAIRIVDPERGTTVDRRVWMNHPTWYRGWKIAQASWNPDDLSQSVLQVKREPVWVTALTWGGSAIAISGIATLFYGRPVAKQLSGLFDRDLQSDEGSTVAEPTPTPPERGF